MDILWSRKKPIVIGPWRSELGFEILYWLPYLSAWRHRHHIDKDRLIVLTRGGAGIWYDAGQSVELLDYVPPADLRLALLRDTRDQQSIKQTHVQSWERTVQALVAQRLGLRHYTTLHPSVMYQALEPWWNNRMTFEALHRQLRFESFPVPSLPLEMVLPEKFVVVRFYQRATWPLVDDVLDWVQQLVAELAKHIAVIVLTCPEYADDHVDFPISGPNITSIGGTLPFRQNLGVQSTIISKATAFVGTYGGTMQLAVRLGVPAAGFALGFRGTAYAHKMLTEWLGVQLQKPVFIGRPSDAEFVRQIIGIPLDLPRSMLGSSGNG